MLSALFSLPFTQTRFFSPLISDYLSGAENAKPLFSYPVSEHLDVKTIISNRNKFPHHRTALTNILRRQHSKDAHTSPLLEANIQALSEPNTFSICTAHQPHIAMGPMYVIYKTIHTIQWARYLAGLYPEYKFVPIFFIGSEDADKGELLEVYVRNKPLRYHTWQKGAVGRMHTQEWRHLRESINALLPQASASTQEIIDLLDRAYKLPTMTDAFRYLLGSLFAKEGLVMLDVDDAELKRTCLPLFIKEIEEKKTTYELQRTSAYIKEKYNTYQLQASDTNLFHLADGVRQKVGRVADFYLHPAFVEPISKDEYIAYISQHPETVSPNAMLRTLLQEYLLPNIAFVGGTGEIAYWLQLKNVFSAMNVHYPYLSVRHSTSLIDDMASDMLHQMNISFQELIDAYPFQWNKWLADKANTNSIASTKTEELFAHIHSLHQEMMKQGIADERQLEAFEKSVHHFYQHIQHKHLRKIKSSHRIDELQYLYEHIFPFGKLQERTYSFIDAYHIFGGRLVEDLLHPSPVPSVPLFRFVGKK